MKPLPLGHKRVLFKQAEFFSEMLISTSSLGSQKQEKNLLHVKIHGKGQTLSALTTLLEKSKCFSPLIMEKHWRDFLVKLKPTLAWISSQKSWNKHSTDALPREWSCWDFIQTQPKLGASCRDQFAQFSGLCNARGQRRQSQCSLQPFPVYVWSH